MAAPDTGQFRWQVPADAPPPGGYYKGLPIWSGSPLVHERALEVLGRHVPPPARVVDLGAGAGALAQRLLDAGYRDVEAVERRAESFAVPGVRVHALDLDGDFVEAAHLAAADAVVAVEIIEHLENPWAFARQCARLVRPGGVVVVTVPNIESSRSRVEFLLAAEFRYFTQDDYEQVGHRTVLGSRMVRNVFEAAGFEFLEQTYDRYERPRGPWSGRKALRWFFHTLAFPLMKGDKRGEVTIFAFRRKG